MKLTIDTEGITENDRTIIMKLFDLVPRRELEETRKAAPVQLAVRVNNVQEAIMQTLRAGSMTVQELQERIGCSSSSLYTLLGALKREKVVDDTTSRPKKYFLRALGDDELAAILPPPGTKVQVMR